VYLPKTSSSALLIPPLSSTLCPAVKKTALSTHFNTPSEWPEREGIRQENRAISQIIEIQEPVPTLAFQSKTPDNNALTPSII